MAPAYNDRENVMNNYQIVLVTVGLALAGAMPVIAQQHGGSHGSQTQRETALSNTTQKMGPFTAVVQTLDPSKTLVGVALFENGRPVPPNAVPTQIEYVARNVPFSPLPGVVSGSHLVGQIPATLVDSYTLRVTLKWNGSSYQQRFFINRQNKQQGAR